MTAIHSLIVDPAAYTPPYVRALADALCRRGLDIDLITTEFPHGPVPEATCYDVHDFFYRRGRSLNGRARRMVRIAQHIPDQLRFRRFARGAQIVHHQWFPVPHVDRFLRPTGPASVMTMHWRLPDPRSSIGRAYARILQGTDHIIIHTDSGRRELIAGFGVDGDNVSVIPHGAFDYLLDVPGERPLPDELARVTKPVVLAFGLIRPYKGTDVLLEAFRQIPDAELWIVGSPRLDMSEIRRVAGELSDRVRLIERFVPDHEVAAYFRRADVIALPYRHIEQSGVLYSALAFGKPLVLSDVGGFPEIAAAGAATLTPAGDADRLAEAIDRLLGSPDELERQSAAADALRTGAYSWDRIAASTEMVYRSVLDAR